MDVPGFTYLCEEKPDNWLAVSNAAQRPAASGDIAKRGKFYLAGAAQQTEEDPFFVQRYVKMQVVSFSPASIFAFGV